MFVQLVVVWPGTHSNMSSEKETPFKVRQRFSIVRDFTKIRLNYWFGVF